MTYILGINWAYHESAACLLRDGAPVAFAEEERFNRCKHGKTARVDNADELPRRAIEFCLRRAGIGMEELDAIGLSFEPRERLRNVGLGEPVLEGDWGSETGEALFQSGLRKVPAALGDLSGTDVSNRLHWIEHHLCHAASAFLASPFEEAAVLSIDGIGEFGTTWLGHGLKAELRRIAQIDYPHSLGFLWEKLAQFLGFGRYDACKVMGLAAGGDPKRFAPEFARLVSSDPEGGLRLSADQLRFRTNDFGPLEALLGPKRRNDEPLVSRHSDITAALQVATNKVFLDLAGALRRRTNSPRLCLAGGVALNCVGNRAVQESGLFEELYIQPAAHDAGTALGAAAWLWSQRSGSRGFVLQHPYFGPEYTETELVSTIERHGLRYRRAADPAAEAARLVAERAVTGWFQGRMEVGPRALGNRSLLADPRRPDMRSRINQKIKHREPFQPFAPAVLAERASEWFEIPAPSRSSDFMLFAYAVRPERAGDIPAVVHVDGTSRIQTVRRETNPLFHRLVSEFDRRTGVPMVLNTSFNDSEPIVCSPEDALQTFRKTQIDALVLGPFVIEREAA